MDRRSLLKMIALATGTAMIGVDRLAAEILPRPEETTFSAGEIALFEEIAETIIPATDTPGAKDAEIGAFMAGFVPACYTPRQQAALREGFAEIDARATAATGHGFMAMDREAREALLLELDAEAWALDFERVNVESDSLSGGIAHYYTLMKQLTLFGFFTSRVGGTEVLRYVAVPGRYDGDLAYDGEPAWATT